MQNKSFKLAPTVVASMLAATSGFAAQNTNAKGANGSCRPQDSFQQGYELSQSQMMAAYNAPARIDVRGAWDVFITGSFIYWQPTQDSMSLGSLMTGTNTLIDGTYTGTYLSRSSDFHPGFKVGLGMNFDHDNWDTFLEYTRLHGETTTSATAGSGQYINSNWGDPDTNTAAYNSMSSAWRVNYDAIDWQLARAYYNGTSLTFRPFFGPRAAFFEQTMTNKYARPASTVQNTDSRSYKSWGIGAMAGIESRWLLGEGFRLYGDAQADILYTHYHDFSTVVDNVSVIAVKDINMGQQTFGLLRPHMDVELGIGWGTYFDTSNWHFDLLAGYNFQVFWNQNMFRTFFNDVTDYQSVQNLGNLYMQGLTITARFDF
jgi:hypothetical protein